MRRATSGAPRSDDVVDGVRLFAGRALGALLGGEVVVERDGGAALDCDAILALTLRDYHALREVLGRLGAIEVRAAEVVCRNCDHTFEVDLARMPAQELADRMEDDADEPWETERVVRVAAGKGGKLRGRSRQATLHEVRVDEARAYWRELARAEPMRVTPALVRAMGIVRFGEATVAGAVARELAGAPDAAWDAIDQAFDALAYDPRAFVAAPCPHCAAIHELLAPYDREAGGPDARRGAPPPRALADAATFEALVRRIGAEVYAARGADGVSLRVEPGVPHVDDAGEPLLGSYEPAAQGLAGDERVVTLYHRTFEKMWREDGAYDVEAEVRETIDHELTHHFHDLAGHDPLDEEEREEARRDVERTYGKRAVERAVRRAWLVNGAVVVGLVAVLALGLFLLDRMGVLH